MSSLIERTKAAAAELLAKARNWWHPLRAAWHEISTKGHRLARSGQHRNTMLTRHEQTRRPAGSKLWRKALEGKL